MELGFIMIHRKIQPTAVIIKKKTLYFTILIFTLNVKCIIIYQSFNIEKFYFS